MTARAVANDGRDQMSIEWSRDLGFFTAPFFMGPTNTRVVRRSNALTGFRYGRSFQYRERMLAGKGGIAPGARWRTEVGGKLWLEILERKINPQIAACRLASLCHHARYLPVRAVKYFDTSACGRGITCTDTSVPI